MCSYMACPCAVEFARVFLYCSVYPHATLTHVHAYIVLCLFLLFSVGQIGKVLSNRQALIAGGGQNAVRGAPMQSLDTCRKPGLLLHLTSRATHYMEKLRCDAPDSVPYVDVLLPFDHSL